MSSTATISTASFVDADGNPTDPDPDADTIIVINRELVMRRENAEQEGRDILGPAEGTPDDVDAVRVAREG
ncbi:hypothetical protein [Haloplanus natans]|uniref:hypothetical protein n=1 Tax=Haloplanus natans TaxID=376171 RepID=UPI000677FDDE|nr:hypothetical protein [Haloplanus natans]